MTPDPDADGTLAAEIDVELSQILALSLLPFDSANPFQRSGLGMADPTWSPVNRAAQTGIRARIEERFKGFERQRRAKLVEIAFSPAVDGAWTIAIDYLSLETSRQGRVERPLGA